MLNRRSTDASTRQTFNFCNLNIGLDFIVHQSRVIHDWVLIHVRVSYPTWFNPICVSIAGKFCHHGSGWSIAGTVTGSASDKLPMLQAQALYIFKQIDDFHRVVKR